MTKLEKIAIWSGRKVGSIIGGFFDALSDFFLALVYGLGAAVGVFIFLDMAIDPVTELIKTYLEHF